jgi:two-component system sensor histidine kinase KdpD
MDQMPQARPRVFPAFSNEVRALLAGISLTLITAASYHFHAGVALAAFLYFVIVVVHSVYGSLWASVLISISAAACVDYFFVPPVLSFRVADPLQVLGLATFLMTSLTINTLSHRLKKESLTSTMQRANVDRLHELARQLLAYRPAQITNAQTLVIILNVFQLKGACLYDGSLGELHEAGESGACLRQRTRETFESGLDSDDPRNSACYRVLRLTGGAAGAIGFHGLQDPTLIAGPVAALAALTMERARISRSANHAAALAETETFRTTILDALAHEFKTPLSTILTAAGGMRQFGPLAPTQLEFAEIVETEASRLGVLTTRLLRTARLESDQVVPKPTKVDLEQLVLSIVKRYSKLSPDRRFHVVTFGDTGEVRADPELLRLALSQLLDNATKYSIEHSTIDIELERRNDWVTISIWNCGPPIPEAETKLVFERYYRGVDVRNGVTGSGLGLHVARRIAAAQSGEILYESRTGKPPAVVFRIRIPVG